MINKIKSSLTYTRIIALSFLGIILFGAVALCLPISSRSGQWTPFLNSLFTSTSATCVTGLVVYDTYSHWSAFGQIIILALIQVGGIGLMTIVTLFAMLMGKTIGLHDRRLLMQSAGSMQIGGVVSMLRRIAAGTLLFEGLGAVILAFRFCPEMGMGTGIYYAVFHSISAFCNAGYDLMGRFEEFSSLTRYSADVVVNLTICGLIVIGGIGFVVWNDILQCGIHLRKYKLHSKIVLMSTFVLIVAGAVLFYLFERHNLLSGVSGKEAFLSSLFSSITPRTAGFNTVNNADLSESSSLLTMVLMFIGGSPGSTAGGIKTTTFMVLLLGTITSARHTSKINVFKRSLEDGILRQVASIAAVYLFMIVGGTMIICAVQPFGIKEIFFETISAIGTVGSSMGVTPQLTSIPKVVLILLMYSGRLGGLTLALAFAEKRRNIPLDRPSEKILIG